MENRYFDISWNRCIEYNLTNQQLYKLPIPLYYNQEGEINE